MKLNTKPLAQIELGFPVVVEGVYHGRIEKAEIKENNAKTGNNLVVTYKVLDNPVVRHKDGVEIENKGQVQPIRRYSLVPTPDYDPDRYMKELAVAIGHPPESDLEVENLADKLVMVKLSVKPKRKDEKTGKEYEESNDVDRVTPVPADDTFSPPLF